jgi:hypothetical protein
MDSRLQRDLILRINLALAFLGGILTLVSMTREPSEAEAAVVGGFSLPRLLIIGVIILFLSFSAWLFVISLRRDFWFSRSGNFVFQVFFWKPLPIILLLLLVLLYLILFSSEQYLGDFSSYRERLSPLLVWFAFLLLQVFITLSVVRWFEASPLKLFRAQLRGALVVSGILGLLVLFIAWSRIGLTPDVVYWQDAGVPLVLGQVIVVWMAGIIYHRFLEWDQSRPGFLKIKRVLTDDRILFLTIWLLAFVLWLDEPLRTSYNSLAPVPPNFQSYPFGDAIYYDIHAQYFLIGRPIPAHFWVKPLYTLFLSVLHLIAGQDYAFVIGLQVGFLAIIPSLVYLLVSTLSNRPAGLVAALLVTVRELNGISLTNIIQVSNSKFLMGDNFGMLWMVLLILLMIYWLRNPSENRLMPVAVGGTFGLLVLSRGNSILLLPVILVIIVIFIRYLESNFWREGVLLFVLGLLVSLAPWVWRNYQLSGKLTLQDAPTTYGGQLANLYSLDPNVGHGIQLPGETKAEFQARMQKQMLTFVVKHPGEVIRFVSAHYFHNLIFSYTYLPQSFQVESLRSYTKRLPFWAGWTGQLETESYVLLVVNLGMIALGAGVLWKKAKILVLIPVFMGLGYILSISVSRLSGWRFIIPFDWIVLVFYSVGMVQVAKILMPLPSRDLDQSKRGSDILSLGSERSSTPTWPRLVILCLPFLFLGLGITNGHKLNPYLYPRVDESVLLDEYMDAAEQSETFYSAMELEEFLKQGGASIVYGRALYPSYLPKDRGEWNVFWPVFDQRSYARIAFHLIGPQDIGVVLPQDSPPSLFPDAVDVIVLGCTTKSDYVDYMEGLVVLVKTDPMQLFVHSRLPDLICPLP